MTTYHTLITNNGKAQIANAINTNTKVAITHLAVGDGRGATPTPSAGATRLAAEKARVAVNHVGRHATNANWIEVHAIIPSSTGGFTVREIGLYAGATLIAVGSFPATYKPSATEGGAREMSIKLIIAVENASIVNVTLDDSLVYATRKWAQDNFVNHDEVIDNLTSTETTKPLSAAQGKALQDNKTDKSTTIIAGNGLTGGGNMTANRTVALGTPSQITASSTNSVTATSHTHAIDKASTSVAGVVQLNDTLTSTATNQALTANQGKVLDEKITAVNATANTKANQSTTLTAGNGLTGGGNMTANRTVALGTPSQITATSTNSVTATSHTHAIDKASTTVAGVVQLVDNLTTDDATKALSAAQGKALQDNKADKRAVKFFRPWVRAGSIDVNLDLTKRSSIEAYFGDEWVYGGVMQAVFHNSMGNHVFVGLPLGGQRGQIQLTFYSMGGFSAIECYYMALNRFFRTSVNFNHEELNLYWKEFVNVDGNVASASRLATARTLAITGDGTGQANFDGSANATIALTLANSGVTAGSYNSVTVDAKGRVTRGLTQTHGLVTATSAAGTTNTATTNTNTFLNIVASGVGQTASVGSSTQITGTNGITVSSDTAGKLIVTRDNNSPTASKLATARTLAITGDGTGQANFDGSANATIALTLANSGVTAGSYNSVTVDAKGRVTRGLTQTHGLVTATTATGTANTATTNGNTFLNIVASGVGQTASVGSSTQITGTNGISVSSDTAGKLIVTRDNNSPTASKLATARNIALTGAVTGNVNFDGSGNVSLATTLNLTDFANLKSENGYQKLPNGLIFQWGRTPLVADESSADITFPVAFPTAVVSIQLTEDNNTTRSAHATHCVARQGTTTGFNFWINSTLATSTRCYWFAIGY